MAIYSRPEGADELGAGWVEHASGSLIADGYRDDVPGSWPVDGEEPGLELAYVTLDESVSGVDGFGVHPVLLQAGLDAGVPAGSEGSADAPTEVPVLFSGVRLRRSGAVSLRFGVAEVGERCWSVSAVDDDGAAVLLIDEVRTGPLTSGGWSVGRVGRTGCSGSSGRSRRQPRKHRRDLSCSVRVR